MERNLIGELNMMKESGAKPNFTDIARGYGVDRHTVARYWNGGVNLPRFRLHPYAAFRAAPSRCPAPDSAGPRFPGAERIPTPLQKAPMHSRIPGDARSRVSKVLACTHPASMGPMSDSTAASSRGDGTEPVGGSTPASRMVPPGSGEAHRPPRPPWRARPLPGRLLATAISSASSAGSAPVRSGIDRPTITLDHMPMAAAG